MSNHLINRMKQCELYALYWMNSANNGTCLSRKVFKYNDQGQNVPLTDEELRQDAMQTALNHIGNFGDAMDQLVALDY